MRSFLIATVAATTIGIAAAAAQSTGGAMAPRNDASQPKTTPDTAGNSAATGEFIDKQATGLVRAPKLVGVSVYDDQNKSVGKVDDLLLDRDGSVKAVVIGIGGFLGIGQKQVALPYSAIRWQTEQRTVATNEPPPDSGMGQSSTANADLKTKKVDPVATETYQGYPDRAVVQLSQAQLKAAPEFKYATNPEATPSAAAPSAATPTPAQKP
jgi:sporulation protein YlmC with PRC-barrel domain